jgi:hypothetical protein
VGLATVTLLGPYTSTCPHTQSRNNLVHACVFTCLHVFMCVCRRHLTGITGQRIFVCVWGRLPGWGIVAHRGLTGPPAGDWAPRRGLSPWLQAGCWETLAPREQDVLRDTKASPPRSPQALHRGRYTFSSVCSSGRHNLLIDSQVLTVTLSG